MKIKPLSKRHSPPSVQARKSKVRVQPVQIQPTHIIKQAPNV